MLVEISSMGLQPSVGSADEVLVSEHSPVTVSLRFAERERLHLARLLVQRTDGGGLATPSILVDRGPRQPGGGVGWIAAGWGDARQLCSVAFTLVAPAASPRLRVQVAIGGGGWKDAPGVVATVADRRVHVSLYDTVADRVRVEQLDDRGRPVPLVLAEDALEVELGDEPRDFSLGLRGHEPSWHHRGPLPEGGVEIPGLAPLLRTRIERGETTLALELRAEVAGDLGLRWEFSTTSSRSEAAAEESSARAPCSGP